MAPLFELLNISCYIHPASLLFNVSSDDAISSLFVLLNLSKARFKRVYF